MHDIQLAIHNVQGTLASMDVRKRAIYSRRRVAESPQTLEELGTDFGLTRERVRQLESELVAELREAGVNEIVEYANLPITERFVVHVSQLGDSETSEFFRPGAGSALELLKAVGGVESWEGPWVSRGFRSIYRKVRGPYIEYFKSQLAKKSLTLSEAQNELKELGLDPVFAESFLNDIGFTIFFNRVRPVNIDAISFVEDMLEAAGRPLRWDTEIEPVISKRWNARGILGRVQELKDRFTRTNVNEYASVSLGLPPYEGISREIEKLITKHGPIKISLVCEILTSKFEVAEDSVRAYAKQGNLITDQGIVQFLDKPAQGLPPKFDELNEDQVKNIEVHPLHTVYKFPVNHDRLRGSGMPVSKGVAALIGLAEESQLEFEVSGVPEAVLKFSWKRGAQPQMSSVRKVLEFHEAVLGDWLELVFQGPLGSPESVTSKLQLSAIS